MTDQVKRQSEHLSGVPNVTYDLIAVLHNKLDAVAAMEQYKRDAQEAGNRDAESFFDQCQQTDRSDIERLRSLVVDSLQSGTRTGT
jgi:LmbE family N-acetylglucosaminyl deacetylase